MNVSEKLVTVPLPPSSQHLNIKYIHTYMDTCTHTHSIHMAYIHTYIHTYTAYIRTYVHTYVQTHTHTHTYVHTKQQFGCSFQAFQYKINFLINY